MVSGVIGEHGKIALLHVGVVGEGALDSVTTRNPRMGDFDALEPFSIARVATIVNARLVSFET